MSGLRCEHGNEPNGTCPSCQRAGAAWRKRFGERVATYVIQHVSTPDFDWLDAKVREGVARAFREVK